MGQIVAPTTPSASQAPAEVPTPLSPEDYFNNLPAVDQWTIGTGTTAALIRLGIVQPSYKVAFPWVLGTGDMFMADAAPYTLKMRLPISLVTNGWVVNGASLALAVAPAQFENWQQGATWNDYAGDLIYDSGGAGASWVAGAIVLGLAGTNPPGWVLGAAAIASVTTSATYYVEGSQQNLRQNMIDLVGVTGELVKAAAQHPTQTLNVITGSWR